MIVTTDRAVGVDAVICTRVKLPWTKCKTGFRAVLFVSGCARQVFMFCGLHDKIIQLSKLENVPQIPYLSLIFFISKFILQFLFVLSFDDFRASKGKIFF